jgi:TonB family protein
MYQSRLAILIALLACIAPTLHAEDAAPASAKPAVLVPAVPIERKKPIYPANEKNRASEGWVLVSYIVTVDGSVREPRVVDASGLPSYQKAALQVVPGWTFKPATLDGVPIEQSLQSRINFTMEGSEQGARGRFVRAYRDANTALDSGDIDKARTIAAKLEAETTFNLYEDAWLWLLKARLAEADKDAERQLLCLRRATSDTRYLPPAPTIYALLTLFRLEVDRGHYRAALQVNDRLERLKNTAEQMAALAPTVAQIRALQTSSDAIARMGNVAEASPFPWMHQLLRHAFGIDEVAGSINGIELRCKAQARRLEWASDRTWKIPGSWGKCTVFVDAAPGTRFRLVEYPSCLQSPPSGAPGAAPASGCVPQEVES